MPRHPRGFCFPAHCVFPSAFFHPGPQWPVGQWFLQPSSPIVSVLGMWEVGSALWRCSPEPVFQSSYTQSGLSGVVHQYFQIPGHRPLELLTWHLGLLGLILGRDPPLASVRAAGVVQQRGEHSAGAGTHPSLRFHSLLWAPGAGRRGSPLLPGGDDAHLSGLWGGSPEVFAGCEVLRRP